MEIIDVHAHMAFNKIYPTSYLAQIISNGQPDDIAIQKILPVFLSDKLCDSQIRQMDLAGIRIAVLLIIDGGLGMGEPPLSLDEIYKLHYKVLQNHPSRFKVFAGIDPRRGKYGLELFKRGVFDYGFTGLKLYPPMGYKMNDRKLYEYYQICSDNELAVLIHTGPSLPSLRNELANPKYIFNVAKDFPKVNFILAHAGYNLLNPAVKHVMKLPNVYLDIAGFQSMYTQVNELMVKNLGEIFSENVNAKILFGSDWPLFNTFSPLINHVNLIKDLHKKVGNMVDNGLENILYNNAKKALRLNN